MRSGSLNQMTIKELIELNDNIGDLEIELRDQDGKYIVKYHIGPHVGREPIKRNQLNKNDVYKEVNINAYETKRLCQLLLNKIPKKLLDLEVHSWKSDRTYRKYGHDLERVLIRVYSGYYPTIAKEESAKQDVQLEGQIEITDFPEWLP